MYAEETKNTRGRQHRLTIKKIKGGYKRNIAAKFSIPNYKQI